MTREEVNAILDRVFKEAAKHPKRTIEDYTWSEEKGIAYRSWLSNPDDQSIPPPNLYFIDPYYSVEAGRYTIAVWAQYVKTGGRILPTNWLANLIRLGNGKPVLRIKAMSERGLQQTGEFKYCERDLLKEMIRFQDRDSLCNLYDYIDWDLYGDHKLAIDELLENHNH